VLTRRQQPQPKWLRRSTRRQPLGMFAAVALALFGCNLQGGQTGTEATPRDHTSPPVEHNSDAGSTAAEGSGDLGLQCDSKASVVALGNAKALGFSAEDVLAIAEGAHEASLAWRAPSTFEAFGATGTFESGTEDDRITLTVTHTDGEVRLVEFTPKQPSDAGANGTEDIAIDASCPPARLEIDVRVRLETRDGAFDESFKAVLVASDPLVATLSHPLAREDVDGSFEVELSDVPSGETITVGPVDVQASLYSGGMAGTLSSFIEQRSGEVATAGTVQYARWPADDPCAQSSLTPTGVGGVPLALGAAFGDTTAAEILTELEAVSDVPVTWADESRTRASLGVSARGSSACLLTGDASPAPDGAALLRIPVDITLETEDGRVDAALAGTLDVASAAESEPVTLDIAAFERCDSDDAAAQCGWPDADTSGYQALRVELSLQTEQPASASTIHGTVTLAGIAVPDCASEPVPAPDEGGEAASPGCAGEQQTELDSGAIGAP
jgi:hypothetical protein